MLVFNFKLGATEMKWLLESQSFLLFYLEYS